MAITVTGFWYHSHYTGFSGKIKKYCISLQGTFLRNVKKRSLEREPYPDSAGIVERLHFSFRSGKHSREEILLCAAMVNSVSASCVKTTPRSSNCSSVNLQARALARAVMEAVNSHEFTRDSPPAYTMKKRREVCSRLHLEKKMIHIAKGSDMHHILNQCRQCRRSRI